MGRCTKTHNRFGSLLAATAILGTLICLSTLQGQEDPVYREWRQRIARTSRILLREEAENPFAGPVGSEGLMENEGSDRGAPLESLSGLLIRRATEGAGPAGGGTTTTPATATGLTDGRALADWDWRERFRWFPTRGATPSSATATQEASGESRIQPSTSAYRWIQNPFKAP